MRKVMFAAVLLVLLLPSLALAKPLDVTSVGFDKGGSEAAAVDKMCMAAAGHTLAFIIPPSREPDSDFIRIIKAHYKEVTSNPRVLHTKKDGGAVVTTGKVIVDFDRLKSIVRTEIKGFQNENTDAVACFLIRVTGIDNPQMLRSAYGDVLQTYEAVFDNLGFKVKAGEAVTPEVLKNLTGESFEAYCQRVGNAAKEDIEITYAVIGEISVAKLAETEMGVTWESTAHLQAVDFTGSDAVIFRFDDDYKLSGRDEKVGLFAMRKAALNSSRALAEHTLDYWKMQH